MTGLHFALNYHDPVGLHCLGTTLTRQKGSAGETL